MIDEICREIEEADIFCADLTGMNANVMFELGYAIAMNRRIWLGLDTTFVDAKSHFEQLRVLTTVGYSRYCNSKELSSGFFKDEPYNDLADTVFEKAIRPSLGPALGEKILYLKSRHETEASIRISNLVDGLRTGDVKVIIDDPKESTVQSLTWYGVQVYSSSAVVCHLTGPARSGARLLNARYALVCGMAYGMGKRLLMISEGDFLAPIDYRDLLHHYLTAAEAQVHLQNWLNEVEKSRYERVGAQSSYASAVKLATELKGLQVGDLGSLTEFLLGLLGASARLPTEFRHQDSFRLAVPLSSALFLRSDIFERLLAAREPDKIVHSKITWRDKELLLRVIDERFVSSHEGTVPPWELWERYFCQEVRGVATRDYFFARSLPRPRDLVFFVKAAISTAVNRGQAVVREQDILAAEKQYSQYALESILVENGQYVPALEQILYEFAGSHARITEREIRDRLVKSGVSSDDHDRIIDHLCALSFMGLQVRPDDSRFAEDSAENKRNLAVAKKLLRPGESLVFTIHPAFWAFLEILAP